MTYSNREVLEGTEAKLHIKREVPGAKKRYLWKRENRFFVGSERGNYHQSKYDRGSPPQKNRCLVREVEKEGCLRGGENRRGRDPE